MEIFSNRQEAAFSDGFRILIRQLVPLSDFMPFTDHLGMIRPHSWASCMRPILAQIGSTAKT